MRGSWGRRPAVVFGLTVACAAAFATGAAAQAGHGHVHAQPVKGGSIAHAVAVLSPASGSNCRGTIWFTQTEDGVSVVADVTGLTPGQQHAIHVHEFGDCTAADAASAGTHYNPENHPHGLPSATERHAGDLGNLQADKDGKAHYEIKISNATIAGEANPIVGRAVIVHAKVDDGGQPVGNAGGRIACGVIGVMKAPEAKAK